MESRTTDSKARLTQQVAAFQNGDQAAFGKIYGMIGDKMLRYAMVMTQNHEDAEDLFQETMIEVIRSVHSLRDPAAFTSWSIQIMRHVYAHKTRRQQDLVARGDEDMEMLANLEDENVSVRPDAAAEEASLNAAVRDEICRLPEEQRMTMVAYYYDELSVREISEMMGVSENTTKSRLFAGRKAMKKGIERYEKRTGIRMHEFVPAPLILWYMRTMFEGTHVVAVAVLKRAFEAIIRETGITASLPTSFEGPLNTAKTGGEPVMEEPGEGQEPGTESGAEEPGDIPEPDAEPSAEEPAEAPKQGPALEPSAERPADPHPEPSARLQPLRAAALAGKARLPIVLTVIATAVAVLTLVTRLAAPAPEPSVAVSEAGAANQAEELSEEPSEEVQTDSEGDQSAPTEDPSADPSADQGAIPPADTAAEDTEEYARAYMSVLALFEKEIHDYDWQWKEPYREVAQVGDPEPVALRDIDGDGVPELFLMAATVHEPERWWCCADLHIFTYKDGRLREVRYDYQYPNEYSPDFYSSRFHNDYVRHEGRMVHFLTTEPNSDYAVFTGKASGGLYIWSANDGSEAAGYRLTQYRLEHGAEESRLRVVADAFLLEEDYGTHDIGEPEQAMRDAEADLDAMIIYGGADQPFGPEACQNSLCESYSTAFSGLQAQKAGQKEAEGDDTYQALGRDNSVHHVGGRLFRYDPVTYEMKYITLGETEIHTLDGPYFSGVGLPYTNGRDILFFDSSGVDLYDTETPIPFVKVDIGSGRRETLFELPNSPDPNAGYYIGAVYDGMVYVGLSGGTCRLWAFDPAGGGLTELQDHVYIAHSSGRYVMTMQGQSMSASMVMPGDIYELNGAGMRHVAHLGDYVSASSTVIDGRFYYAVSPDERATDLSVYRCEPDGSGVKHLTEIVTWVDESIAVERYAELYCTVYLDGLERTINYPYPD